MKTAYENSRPQKCNRLFCLICKDRFKLRFEYICSRNTKTPKTVRDDHFLCYSDYSHFSIIDLMG